MSGPVTLAVRPYLVPLAAAYLIGKMFLVQKSGLPQPTDFILVGLAPFLLRPSDLQWAMQRHPAFLATVAWTFFVSLVWAIIQQNTNYFRFPIYYTYDLVVFLLFVAARASDAPRFDRFMQWAVMGALCMQLAMPSAFDFEYYRGEGTFNNPNQLGYWALCMLSVYLLTRRGPPKLLDVVVIALLTWIEIRTLSRAGLVAIVVLIGLWFVEILRGSRQQLLFMGLGLVGVVALIAIPWLSESFYGIDLVDQLDKRFQRQDFMSEAGFRNTQRITEYSEYIFFGAGEGEVERFNSTIEVHSTFGTMLFSYGIPGFTLFLLMLRGFMKGTGFRQYGVLLAMVIYSFTHNGLRFTFFWIVLAIITSQGDLDFVRRPVKKKRPVRLPLHPVVADPPAPDPVRST